MKIHLLEHSKNVYEAIPAPWDCYQHWEVPVPIINAEPNYLPISIGIYIFLLTLSICFWADFIYKGIEHD